MFKKDNFLTGMLTGIVCPFIFFGILFGIKSMLGLIFPAVIPFPVTKLMFASVVLNVLPLRYFYISQNQHKIAQGIMLITVVLLVTVVLAF